jgi:hypothetical protein
MIRLDIPDVGPVEFPESMTDAEIQKAIQDNILPQAKAQAKAQDEARAKKPAPAADEYDFWTANDGEKKEEEDDDGRPGYLKQFVGDVMRGGSQLKQLGYGLGGMVADAVGADETALNLLQRYQDTGEDIHENNPPTIGTFRNIGGVDDAVRYGIEAVGENLPMFLPSLGTGGIGALAARKLAEKGIKEVAEGLVRNGVTREVAEKQIGAQLAKSGVIGGTAGAYASNAGMEMGSIYGDVYEQTGEQAPGTAAALGAVAGALDSIGDAMGLKRVFGRELAETATRSLFRRLGAAGAERFLVETPTEMVQTILERTAVALTDPSKEVFSQQGIDEIIDAGAKGGLGGVGVGVATESAGSIMDWAKSRGVEPTQENLQNAAAAGDAEALKILAASGMSPEQLAALSPGKATEFAERIATRREEESQREPPEARAPNAPPPPPVEPVITPGMLPAERREAVLKAREATEKRLTRWRDEQRAGNSQQQMDAEIDRRRLEEEGVASGEIDPGAVSRRDRPGLSDVINLGQQRFDDRLVAGSTEDPGLGEAVDQRLQEEVLKQTRTVQAFRLARYRAKKAGEDIRDVQAGGRPEGGVESQKPVLLHQGMPVEVVGRRTESNGDGEDVLKLKVRRYDPRAGDPNVDPKTLETFDIDPETGKPIEYEVEARELSQAKYAVGTRRSQRFEEDALTGKVEPYKSAITGEKVKPDAAGQRIDEVQDLKRQTYRTTEPDPTVPGAEGPTTGVDPREFPPDPSGDNQPRMQPSGPVLRSNRPEQGEGARYDLGSGNRGPEMRTDQTQAEATAHAERRRRMWEQSQEDRRQDETTGEDTEWGRAKKEYEPQKDIYSATFKGVDADGWPLTDKNGYILSTKGGPIRFETQSAMVTRLKELRKQFPDAGIVNATHPGPKRKAKVGEEAYFTLHALNPKPAPQPKEAQAEQEQAAPEQEQAAPDTEAPAPEQPVEEGAPPGLPAPTPAAQPAPKTEEVSESPPAPGHVRMYHGGLSEAQDAPTWFSSDRRYAEGYATKDGRTGAGLLYVDVPENHPLIEPEYPEQSIAQGFHQNVELPAEFARKAKPVSGFGKSAPKPAAEPAAKPAPVEAPPPSEAKGPTNDEIMAAAEGDYTKLNAVTQAVSGKTGINNLTPDERSQVLNTLKPAPKADTETAPKTSQPDTEKAPETPQADTYDPEAPENAERTRRLRSVADRYEALGDEERTKLFRGKADKAAKPTITGKGSTDNLDGWERMVKLDEEKAAGKHTVTQPAKRGPAAPKLIDDIDAEMAVPEEGQAAENFAEGVKHVPPHVKKAATDRMNELQRLRAERGYNGEDEPPGYMKPHAIGQIDDRAGALRGVYNRYVKFLGAFKLGRNASKATKDGKREKVYTAETVGRELRKLQEEIAKPLPTDEELEQDVSKWSVFQLDNHIDNKGAISEDGSRALAELRKRPGWGNRRPNEVIKERQKIIKQLKASEPQDNYAELEAKAADLEEDLARDPAWEGVRLSVNRLTSDFENMTPRQIAEMRRQNAATERERGAGLKTKKAKETSAETARRLEEEAERIEAKIPQREGKAEPEEQAAPEPEPEPPSESEPDFKERRIREGSGKEPGRRGAERGEPFTAPEPEPDFKERRVREGSGKEPGRRGAERATPFAAPEEQAEPEPDVPAKGTIREIDGVTVIATGRDDFPWAGARKVESGPQAGWQPDTGKGVGDTAEEAAADVAAGQKRADADRTKRTDAQNRWTAAVEAAKGGEVPGAFLLKGASRYGDGKVTTGDAKDFLRDMGLTAKQADQVVAQTPELDVTSGGARLYDLARIVRTGQNVLRDASAPQQTASQQTPPAWMNTAADAIGGRPIWWDEKREIGLAAGYSVLSGQPVYTGVKGTSRTRVDIESYTGTGFTADEKADLIAAKKADQEADAKALAKNPDGPFTGGERLAASPGVPTELVETAREWLKMLGINARVFLVTTAEARTLPDMHGPFTAIRSAGIDANEFGSTRRLANGDHYVALKLSARDSRNLETLAHEIGHILEKEAYKTASAEEKAAIHQAYESWVRQAKSGTAAELVQSLRAHTSGKQTKANDGPAVNLPPYWTSLSEWFADQVSRWAVSSQTPQGVVAKFFKRVADGLRQLYAAATGKKYLPNAEMAKWLDGRATASVQPLQGSQSESVKAEAPKPKAEAAPAKTLSVAAGVKQAQAAVAADKATWLEQHIVSLNSDLERRKANKQKLAQEARDAAAAYDADSHGKRMMGGLAYTAQKKDSTSRERYNNLDEIKKGEAKLKELVAQLPAKPSKRKERATFLSRLFGGTSVDDLTDDQYDAEMDRVAPKAETVDDVRRILADNVERGILNKATANGISEILDRLPANALKGIRIAVQDRLNAADRELIGVSRLALGSYIEYNSGERVIVVNATGDSPQRGVQTFIHENAHALFDMISAEHKAEARRIYDALPVSRQAMHTMNYSKEDRFEEWFAESMADHYASTSKTSPGIQKPLYALPRLLMAIHKKIVDLFSNEQAQVKAFFDGLEVSLGHLPATTGPSGARVRERRGVSLTSILTNPVGSLTGDWREWRSGAQNFARDATETWQAKRPNRQNYFANAARWWFLSADGEYRSAIGKFNSPTLNLLADTFHARAGTAQGIDPALATKLGMKLQGNATFGEAVNRKVNTDLQKLDRILDPFRKDKDAMDRIVDLVQNPARRRSDPESKAASEIASMLKDLHKYMTDAGVDVGQVKNGYFPREPDVQAVMKDHDGFVTQATKAYQATGLNAKDAKEAANKWLSNILYGGSGVPVRTNSGTVPSFVQSRVLTKQADEILKDYYQRDVDLVLGSYISRAAKRAEIARRFGDGWKNWEEIEKQIRKEDPAAAGLLGHLRDYAAIATGVQNYNVSQLVRSGSSLIRTVTSLSLLEKSTFSSLAEAITPAIRTGNFLDLIPALTKTLSEVTRQLRDLPPSVAAELAADIGAIAGSGVNSAMAARFAGGDPLGRGQARVLSSYFRRIGLEQWTNATLISSTERGSIFLRRLASNITTGGYNPKSARLHLAELGIPADQVDEFVKYVNTFGDNLPSPADLDKGGEMATAYRTALLRFVDQTIMRPSATTRPRWASHPVGAVAFQLQAFTYAFSKNVLMRSVRLGKTALTPSADLTMVDRTLLLAPLLMLPALAMVQFEVGKLRDWLYMDPQRRKAQTPAAQIEKAISRAGLTGILDPYLQMVTNSRYQRDPISTFTGPFFGIFGTGLGAAIQRVANNAPGTNAAERKAAEAVYDVLFEPGINILLGYAPGSLLASAITTGFVPAMRDNFTDAVAGKRKGHKQQKVFGLTDMLQGKQFAKAS